MNERDYRINNFLNYLATVQKQNPSISLPENIIYRELVRIGVPDKEKIIQSILFLQHLFKILRVTPIKGSLSIQIGAIFVNSYRTNQIVRW